MRKLFSICALVCAIYVAMPCVAQEYVAFAQSGSVDIIVTPENPVPLSKIQLTAVSYDIDLDQAKITWAYNGKIIPDGTGIGVKTITMIAPNSGVSGNVTVTVEAIGMDPATAQATLNPASVDILWQAVNSYTPPFYKGKAKPSTGAVIRATAIPAYSAPKQVSYNWKQNDDARQSASGVNKNSLTITNKFTDNAEVFTVDARGGAFDGSGKATAVIGEPSLVGYENNAGFIDYANGSVNSISTSNSGMVLRLEPFFFSIQDIARDLIISVTAPDDSDVPVDSVVPNEIRFSKPENSDTTKFTIKILSKNFSNQGLKRIFSATFR